VHSVKATFTGRLVEGAHVHRNLSIPQLVEAAIARGEASLADNGALVALTGARTGRSPRDKFIVRDSITSDTVDWGKVNQPFDPAQFEALMVRVTGHMRERDLYVQDLYAGADEHYRLPVQVIAEYAWNWLAISLNSR
jgi:phosphoenolpyruvate carboxykinase (ATP)